MSIRYCDHEEQERIIEMYAQTEKTLRYIADTFHISVGTVTNIIKGYPYTDKTAYRDRITKDLHEKITSRLTEIQGSIDESNPIRCSCEIFKYIELSALAAHEETLLQSMKQERLYFEMKAWQAFEKGKHLEFGYMAEMWQELTDLIQDNAKNPWRSAAKKVNAYGKVHNIKFSYVPRD